MPSVPAASTSGLAGAQLPREGQRQMGIAPAAPVIAPAASPSIRRPTRARRPCVARNAATKLARDRRPHRRRNACARASSSRPCAARRLDRAAHRGVDIGDHDAARCASARPRRAPNNPEPITSGSSPGTSEMNSASARALAEQPRDAAALERERRARSAFSVAMSQPAASPRALSARSSSSDDTVDADASTRLELPPETRNSGEMPARRARDAPLEFGAGRETARVRHGMRALENLRDAGRRASSGSA